MSAYAVQTNGVGQAARHDVAAVSFRDVTKVYAPQPRWMRLFSRTPIREPVAALRGVTFDVRFGEILAVVGPNGAGKTTMFRIVVGLTTPTSGHVSVAGLDTLRAIDDIRQLVGWMSAEERSLLMRATCRENLQLHGRLQGLRPPLLPRRIDTVLEMVGLAAQRDAIAASLSAGMKARLRLARALLPSPQVLLLDEPTGALDPLAAKSLLDLVTELVRQENLAVLLSSHRLEEIDALRSNAVLMDRGRIRFSGSLDDLRERIDVPTVEIRFDHESTARQAEKQLMASGNTVDRDGRDVYVRLTVRTAVGDVLATLGSLLPHVHRIGEVTTPLRDVIASAYEDDNDESR